MTFDSGAGPSGAQVRAPLRVVDGVSFSLSAGRNFCLVGESGCGKSVTALALPGLLPRPAARVLSGRAEFEGRDLLALSEGELVKIRGARIGMVFQEPMTSLNPVFSIGRQCAEPLRLHFGLSRKEAELEAVRLLERVGLSGAARLASAWPHELSGGMRQRALIAMAIACGPSLLIADEPTTALDAGLQGQILDLLTSLQEANNGALFLITHDLDAAAAYADSVAVMYCGKIVESGPAQELLRHPAHPYTLGLLAARPSLRPGQRKKRLSAIAGSVPPPARRPQGCAFSNRCPRCGPRCSAPPPVIDMGPGHSAACWLP